MASFDGSAPSYQRLSAYRLPLLFCRRQKSQAFGHWFVMLMYRFPPYS